MIKKWKNRVGDLLRGFHGLYENRRDKFFSLPKNMERGVVGYSVEDREISYFKFGENGKLKILFMGGIHGNEVGTIRLMYKFMEYLDRNRMNYLGLEIYVVPCVNPDGAAEALESPDFFRGGRIGRLNANGVDLNRNFATKNFMKRNHWYFGNRFVPVKCGEKGFSEPESKALSEFILKEGISILYSFHSRGREVMGSQDDMAQKLTMDFAEKTGYRYVPEEQWVEMNQTGTVKDWCEEQGLSYIEIESSSRWGNDWKNQAKALISAIKYHYG